MFRTSLGLLVLVGLLATLGLFAAANYTAQASVTNNQFTNGRLALTTDPTMALITYTNMAPGDRVTAPLQISNRGSLALRYAMTSSVTNAVNQIFVGGPNSIRVGSLTVPLAILNPDGTPGPTPFSNPNFIVTAIAVQADGKVIATGNPSFFNGDPTLRVGVLRLQPDGSRDTTFNWTDWNGQPWDAKILGNGQSVIAGDFTQVGQQNHPHVVRLNPDGAVDHTFNSVTLTNLPWDATKGQIYALALQTNGQMVIGGQFDSVNGQPHQNIARLNADGTLDSAFNARLDDGTPASARTLVIQADGKILVAGYFSSVNGGTLRSKLARFNSDGTLDTSFNVLLDDNPESVRLQPDGKIIIAGYFSTVNGQARRAIARLNADGTLDESFNAGVSSGAVTGDVALQPDGNLLFSSGGNLTIQGQSYAYAFGRINGNGLLDAAFGSNSGTVYAFALLPTLAGQLHLAIKSDVTTCTNGGFENSGTLIYNGPLGGAALGDPTPGQHAGDRNLAATAQDGLCFQASLPLGAGNLVQNTSTTATFTFAAEQTANNP